MIKFIVVTATALLLLGPAVQAQETTSAQNATVEFVTYYKYPIEEYTVQTQDGYRLKVYRIPGSPLSALAPGKKAVLVTHGLFTSSIDWVKLGPNQGLPYLLADAGYDVWLPNLRGNTLSRNHISKSPDSKQFWDFSFHEIALYDLPALIDFVLGEVKQEKLHFVGWSGASTDFFILGSEKSSYMSKIISAQMFSPGAYFTFAKSPLFRLFTTYPADLNVSLNLLSQYDLFEIILIDFLLFFVQNLATIIGANEFVPDDSVTQSFTAACRSETYASNILCSNALFLISGYGSDQLNQSQIPIIYTYTPAGTSSKLIVHVIQLMKTFNFQQYDYGLIKNLVRYGRPIPPEYNLSKVNAPVTLWYGPNDWLASTVDVDRLALELPKLRGKNMVDNFSHIDFMWGKDVKVALYEKVIADMRHSE